MSRLARPTALLSLSHGFTRHSAWRRENDGVQRRRRNVYFHKDADVVVLDENECVSAGEIDTIGRGSEWPGVEGKIARGSNQP